MSCPIQSACAPTEFNGDVNILEGSDPLIYGYGSLFIQDNLNLVGNANICGDLGVSGDVSFLNDGLFCDGLTICKDLGVSGTTWLNSLNVINMSRA